MTEEAGGARQRGRMWLEETDHPATAAPRNERNVGHHFTHGIGHLNIINVFRVVMIPRRGRNCYASDHSLSVTGVML